MTSDLNEGERGESGAEAAGTGGVAPGVEAEEREARGGGVDPGAGVGIAGGREEAGAETGMTERKGRMMTSEIMRSKRREKRRAFLQ